MKITKEIKIAVVAIAALTMLFLGLNFLKGISVFQSNDTYYITFKDVSGLVTSSPIYADGVAVGTVADIIFDYDQQEPVKVVAAVDKLLRIPAGSTAEIQSDMMGNTQINLMLATNPRERINPGGVIEGVPAGGAMAKLTAMVPALEQMLPKLDSIMTSLNTILADPAIRNTLHNVETISGNLTTTTQQLNVLVADINHNVPGMMKKADAVLDNTQKLTANLASVDVQATMNQVNATIAEVKATTEAINSTKGTIGLMIHDPSLYNNLNATVRDADSLMVDLKAKPKRYVHFSIFGKK